MWNPVDSWRKKILGKKYRATVPLRQAFTVVFRESEDSKNSFG
jgi:hypothetical protein